VHKWHRRWRAEGDAGLLDRSSRPRRSPARLPESVEDAVVALRVASHRGPVFLAGQLGLAASTVGRVLRRRGLPHLAHVDPVTGEVIRGRRHSGIRYQHPRPGDLLHIDVKKLGRVPDGGGWRAHGRSEQVRGRGIGYDFVHVAIDDHSRVAYAEVLPDERETTCAQFLHRAVAWFRARGVTVRRVLTDNALAYRRGASWRAVCAALQIKRRFTKPGCPWTNGKAERLNRTLLTEWAYSRAWTSNAERTATLDTWITTYNSARAHSALGGQPPMTRLAP
jgi:transposase InsO family protein